MGRVISYGEKTEYNDGDYLLLDNGEGGTKRIRADRVGIRLDPTLTDPNKAAPANTVKPVDAVPTQGSNNAVSSGGVYTALHNTDTTLTQSGEAADAKVVGDEIEEINRNLDYFYETGRAKKYTDTVSGTRYVKKNIELSAGLYLLDVDSIVSNDTDANTCIINFRNETDNTGTTILTLTMSRDTQISESFELSSDVNTIYFYASDTSAHSQGDTFSYNNVVISQYISDESLSVKGKFADAQATGAGIQSAVSAIQAVKSQVINGDNTLYLFGCSHLLTNECFLKNSGVAQTNIYFGCSGFIPVKKDIPIKYKLDSTATTAVICLYSDATEQSFVSYISGADELAEGTFTPNIDGYVRFATRKSSIEESYFYIETDVTPNFAKSEYVPLEKTLNILLLGDSIFGNDGEIAGYLNTMCNSCVNGAFGGTRVTSRGSGDWQYFDGVNIVQALATQTWTAQDAAVENLKATYRWITSRLAGLKAVNMSNVDLICMDWGTNDYTAECTIEEITTAYNTVIDTLQNAYPHVRLLICTPIWKFWGTEQDNQNGDNRVFNVSTLKEIALAIEQFAKDKRISVLNAYQNLPLSYKTAETYFDAIGSGNSGTSYTHLNAFGNQVYAHLIHGKIRSIF